MTCGLFASVASVIVSVPDRVPVVVGLKMTLTVHVPPDAMLPLHELLGAEKSPVKVVLLIVIVETVPLMERVRSWLAFMFQSP